MELARPGAAMRRDAMQDVDTAATNVDMPDVGDATADVASPDVVRSGAMTTDAPTGSAADIPAVDAVRLQMILHGVRV
jgi:hypothetical protein